jgi:hypothetical protein
VRDAIVLRIACVMAVVLSAGALGGCGNLLGIADLKGPAGDAGGDDAAPDANAALDAAPDGAPDAPIGASTVTGKVTTVDSFETSTDDAIGNAMMALFRLPDGVELSRTNSAAGGAYTLTSPTLGIATFVLGGPLADGHRATRRYLPHALTSTETVDVQLYAEAAIQAFASAQFGVQHAQTNNFVVVQVRESSGQPAADVVVQVPATDGVVRYSGGPALAATSANGLAYIFNIPSGAGRITIDSARAGAAFVGFEINLPPQTNGHVTLQP